MNQIVHFELIDLAGIEVREAGARSRRTRRPAGTHPRMPADQIPSRRGVQPIGTSHSFGSMWPRFFDHLERAALGLGDVHVHPHVVLARHHLGRAPGALRDAGVVERRDDVVLVQRPGLVDRRLPELERPVRPGARAARR